MAIQRLDSCSGAGFMNKKTGDWREDMTQNWYILDNYMTLIYTSLARRNVFTNHMKIKGETGDIGEWSHVL